MTAGRADRASAIVLTVSQPTAADCVLSAYPARRLDSGSREGPSFGAAISGGGEDVYDALPKLLSQRGRMICLRGEHLDPLEEFL